MSVRIIEGEWPEVAEALDALPVGSVIEWGGVPGKCVALKENSAMGTANWYEAGYQRPVYADALARHGVPLTVLA